MVDKLFFREESMVLRCSSKILSMLCPILIGPLFHQGFHIRDGLDFLLAHGHRPVRPTRLGPSGLAFCFYPLHPPNPLPQLAHTLLTEVNENSICTTKSTVPSNGSIEALTSTHSNSMDLDHDLHTGAEARYTLRGPWPPRIF